MIHYAHPDIIIWFTLQTPSVGGRSDPHRQQRYRKEWEADPAFKSWLQGVTDPLKAKCRVCNVVMTAELTFIKDHAKGKKHSSFFNDAPAAQVSAANFFY